MFIFLIDYSFDLMMMMMVVLRRVKIVDPSFLNWPALPVALADTIVPDFPLANKSFGLSYAGNDL